MKVELGIPAWIGVTCLVGALTFGFIEEAAVQQLQASVRGEILLPDDARYDETRQVWNGMINKWPALIVRCTGVADVIDSVKFACTHNLTPLEGQTALLVQQRQAVVDQAGPYPRKFGVPVYRPSPDGRLRERTCPSYGAGSGTGQNIEKPGYASAIPGTGVGVQPGSVQEKPASCLDGVQHAGGVTVMQARVRSDEFFSEQSPALPLSRSVVLDVEGHMPLFELVKAVGGDGKPPDGGGEEVENRSAGSGGFPVGHPFLVPDVGYVVNAFLRRTDPLPPCLGEGRGDQKRGAGQEERTLLVQPSRGCFGLARGTMSLLAGTTPDMRISHLEKDAPSFYSTLSMIGLMEQPAIKAVTSYLDSGEQTVAVQVNVSHIAPHLLG